MRMSDGNRMVLDSRPSDAIALALRADCPIYVDAEVIKASRNTVPTEEEGGEESALGEEEWPDVIGEAGDLPMYRVAVSPARISYGLIKLPTVGTKSLIQSMCNE